MPGLKFFWGVRRNRMPFSIEPGMRDGLRSEVAWDKVPEVDEKTKSQGRNQ
jgi:hypothetical protein